MKGKVSDYVLASAQHRGLMNVQARSGRVTLVRVKVVLVRAARLARGALAERRAERTALCFRSADAIVLMLFGVMW